MVSLAMASVPAFCISRGSCGRASCSEFANSGLIVINGLDNIRV